MKTRISSTRRDAKHLYDVEVTNASGKIEVIEVEANTRSQANHMATQAGYVVRSVNMVG